MNKNIKVKIVVKNKDEMELRKFIIICNQSSSSYLLMRNAFKIDEAEVVEIIVSEGKKRVVKDERAISRNLLRYKNNRNDCNTTFIY